MEVNQSSYLLQGILVTKIQLLLLIKVVGLTNINKVQDKIQSDKTYLFEVVFYFRTLNQEDNNMEGFTERINNGGLKPVVVTQN